MIGIQIQYDGGNVQVGATSQDWEMVLLILQSAVGAATNKVLETRKEKTSLITPATLDMSKLRGPN